MSSPLSIARNTMKVAQGCIVFSGGVGAHSLQTMTGIKLGSIASKKKKKKVSVFWGGWEETG